MPDLELLFEAQAAKPNFRYDIIRPVLQGRVPIEGVTIKTTGAMDIAGFFDKPKFKNGDFDLIDTNVGDLIPAIDAGWDLLILPLLIKRKPVYNYMWVRADRGFNAPKDLEGTTWSTGIWGVVATYSRGVLERFHGVDTSTFKWVANVKYPWQMHKPIDVTYASDGKPQWQRLLDGEVDACTGDIIDPKAWEILESSDKVRRLFPNYREMNRKLWKEHHVFTPTHVLAISGKVHRANPGLTRKIYDAFEQSRELAYADALGDGSSYNILMDARETLRDQLKEMGDIWKHGVSANRELWEMTLDFYADQGVTSRRMSIEDIIPADCLDT